jgi:small subunit ribosomal protein S20
MANIKQQKKRVHTAQRQRMQNLRYKSTARTLFRALQDSVNLGDKPAAEKAHKELVRLLDRAASRRALHPNTVARRKARAARVLLQEPVKEAAVVRRAKKKHTPKASTKTAKAKKDTAAATKAAEAEAAKVAGTAAAEEAPVEEAVADETAAEESAPAPEASEESTPEAEAAEEAPAEDNA